MFEPALAVVRFIEAALSVREPTPDAVQRALRIELGPPTQRAMWIQHTATVARGPVERIELSYRSDLGSGSVFFHIRPTLSPPIMHELLDMKRYGSAPLPDMSGSTLTYQYPVHSGTKSVAFQFTHGTHQLLFASVAWKPRAEVTATHAIDPHAPAYQLLHLWLDELDADDITRLWYEIAIHLRGGPAISKTGNAFTIQIANPTATLYMPPAMKAAPLVLPLDTFADATERWFDVVAPQTADVLRQTRILWRPD